MARLPSPKHSNGEIEIWCCDRDVDSHGDIGATSYVTTTDVR